jgi:choline dehydrogenase
MLNWCQDIDCIAHTNIVGRVEDGMQDLDADYVILGGGTAGCVLAARLSEDAGIRVLLLEAGGSHDRLMVRMPMGMGELMKPGPMNWGFETEPEPHLNGRRLSCPRGRLLGGCSSINGMVYARGHSSDFDDWAEKGATGWSYADVSPWFRKAEQWVGGKEPLAVRRTVATHPLDLAFLAAGRSLGWAADTDFNSAAPEGFGTYAQTIAEGRRVSTATAYLAPALSRPNLRVVTGARVLRILLEGRRTIGAEVTIGGNTLRATARREVLLSAGAIQSPHLLQLSGIGDPSHLSRIGITTQHALPGVGRGLKNHPDFWLQYRLNAPISLHSIARQPGKTFAGLRWLLRHDGVLATNNWHVGAFLRTRPDLAIPDVQLMLSHYATQPGSFDLQPWHGFQLHAGIQKPFSSGEVMASSPDPLAPPRIVYNYLADPRDLDTAVAALKLARRVIAAAPFDAFRGAETWPGPAVETDADIARWMAEGLDTAYHPTSTCRMGADMMAVTDPDTRVRGLDGLRVVDASVMPDIVNANPHAAVVMIAEKAAAMIRASQGETHVV